MGERLEGEGLAGEGLAQDTSPAATAVRMEGRLGFAGDRFLDGVKPTSGARALWFAALTAALGGFLFGYDWVVIGGAKPFYEAHFGILEPSSQAWAMSCALVGCLAGAVGSGPISDWIGRRRALLISAATFALSALGTGMTDSFLEFVLWRIVGGVAIGMASVLSPVYIAEISPAQIRGKLVCLNELTIVLGILAAQTVNWLIAQPVDSAAQAAIAASWNGQVGWRRMFEAAAVPAVAFLIGALLIPESPRWLGRRARWDEARAVLLRFDNDNTVD